MVRRLAVGVVVALLVAGLWGAGLGGVVGEGDGTGAQPPQTTPDGYDRTTFEIQVYANASARWTVRHSRPLANETEVERFEAFAAEFEAGDTTAFENFETRARRLVASGGNVTGRAMTAENFDRAARVEGIGGDRGVVELSFTWTGFARQADGRVIIDDVFEGGMYVGPGQRLIVRRGPALQFDEVDPQPDSTSRQGNLTASDSVTWLGETQFTDNRPFVALVPASAGPATTDTGAATPAGDRLGQLLLLVVLALVGIVALAWYTDRLPRRLRSLGGGDGSVATGGSADSTGPSGSGPPSAGGVPDREMLSDEDRVLDLLEANGGRMKQVNIVAETEWSKSKVSMLLSDMEEAGEISKLRVGRENIISLAGQEPDAAGSPFEDE